MNLHPYDNKERVFRYDDASRDDGLVLVAKLLKLPAAPRGARFDLRFFSGGIGIFDHLAIALGAESAEVVRIAHELGFVAPTADGSELEEFLGDCDGVPFADALVEFVAHHRLGFQPDYAPGDPIWIEPESNVNHWVVMWHSNGVLAYLAYDQG